MSFFSSFVIFFFQCIGCKFSKSSLLIFSQEEDKKDFEITSANEPKCPTTTADSMYITENTTFKDLDRLFDNSDDTSSDETVIFNFICPNIFLYFNDFQLKKWLNIGLVREHENLWPYKLISMRQLCLSQNCVMMV